MFHVPLCGCQLSKEEKRRESMHDRLKIASVGSVIFSRSGDGGATFGSCSWPEQCDEQTDKTMGG